MGDEDAAGQAELSEQRTFPCATCGERLPFDPTLVDRHVNERHPHVVGPGVAKHARPVGRDTNA